MNNASVIVCKTFFNDSNTVEHYYNSMYTSNYISPTNPSIGVVGFAIAVVGTYFLCDYERINYNTNPLIFDVINFNPYLIVAYGTLNPSGGIRICYLRYSKLKVLSFFYA